MQFQKKKQFQKSQAFQALFSLVSCLDMQIELKSWSNYSDNLKEKNLLIEKRFGGA